ncbi:MAG: methyltransferase domain-containing protein [Vicinamibacterales bacterium]
MTPPSSVEEIVRERYAAGAQAQQPALCCPVSYDPRFLKAIPDEILERDYGCGDPSKHLKPGETVLDLGSGGGKICYIAAQVVGAEGRVIGVDMTPEMLALANKYRASVGDALGYHNVEFRRGRIQDLRTDPGAVERFLTDHPVRSLTDLDALRAFETTQRASAPLVADASVDVVVSNCVLNLVRDDDKRQLFAEIFRVLRNGGRVVVSDIVADEPVPASLKQDPELWSGCVSGALVEHEFVQAFVDAGLYGAAVIDRDERPWRTVDGIEFRSVTVVAYKGKQGACWDRNQAVIYRGPWSEVRDDDGHTLKRGVPMAVCEKTFGIYTRDPYARDIIPVPPLREVAMAEAKPFDCTRDTVRQARESKGMDYHATTEGAPCCEPGQCC